MARCGPRPIPEPDPGRPDSARLPQQPRAALLLLLLLLLRGGGAYMCAAAGWPAQADYDYLTLT